VTSALVLNISSLMSAFFFASRRRHTRFSRDWSSDVCSSDLLSLKRFCTVHNESIHRVRYWIGKFNKESMDTSSFIPLNFPSGQAVGSEPVEIIYPNGIRIRIP